MRPKLGPAFALAAILVLQGLRRVTGSEPAPGPVLDLAVVCATLVEGLWSGLFAAAITVGYMAWPLLVRDDPVAEVGEDARRAVATHALVSVVAAGGIAAWRRRPGP